MIPERSGYKELDFAVEDWADYLRVNCPDHYEVIVKFARLRWLQGRVLALKDMKMDQPEMSECLMADILNEQHKPIDNEEEQA